MGKRALEGCDRIGVVSHKCIQSPPMRHSDSQVARQEPTLAEFEAARNRELARLNVRLFSITCKEYHTSEDLSLLEGDTFKQENIARETVRLWANRSKKHGEGNKPV